jgi:isopentenyl phosphate kinase
MVMTRKEIAELDKRIADRLKSKGLKARPVTPAEKARIEELRVKKMQLDSYKAVAG